VNKCCGLWIKRSQWMLSLLLINCFVNVIMNFRMKFTNFGRNFWTLWQFCEINCNVSKGVLLWDISVTLDETTDSEILGASLLSLLILALIMPYVLVLKILWHCIDFFKNTFQKIFVSKNIDGTTSYRLPKRSRHLAAIYTVCSIENRWLFLKISKLRCLAFIT
jgi:hypothetical protein